MALNSSTGYYATPGKNAIFHVDEFAADLKTKKTLYRVTQPGSSVFTIDKGKRVYKYTYISSSGDDVNYSVSYKEPYLWQTTYSHGTYCIETKMETELGKYPEDDRIDNIWYVFEGLK